MRQFGTSIAVALSTLLLFGIALAQQSPNTAVPSLIRYGGTLKDAGGGPIATTSGVTFAIYKQQDGGAPVWMETQNVTPDAGGQYSVLLGSTTASGLPSDLFSQLEQRWLGVQVQGQPEQARVLLVSVPYAFKAHEAETLAGKSISDFVMAKDLNSASSGAGVTATAGSVGISSNQATGSGDNKSAGAFASSAGPTDFSGSTTDQIVKVTQSGTGNGIVATTSSTTTSTNALSGTISGAGVAILGHASSASAQAYGIQGTSDSNIGIGLLGFATATSGSTYGLKGYSSSTGGTGVRGLSTATTGITYGVSGAVSSPTGTAMWGQSTAATGGIGVWGQSQATSGAGTGVLATSASTAGTGVVATELATTGTTYGLNAKVQSAAGTAAWLQNTAGGPLILATTGSSSSPVTKFSVDGSGNVNAVGGFTGNGAGLSGIQFSQLTGVLGSAQLSGTYGEALTLSNPSDVYYGDGSHLNGVTAGSGSPYYIQNGTSQQASANFNISGSGTAAGTLAANAINSGTNYQIGGSGVLSIGAPADTNLFVGVGAGASDVVGHGQHNVFLGAGAGLNNNNGILNTFVGYQSGYTNTTGNYNTFTGYEAGYNNTTGLNNSFYGVNAGLANINGRDNVFTGLNAGNSNTGGSYNTFAGSQAGFTNTGGSYNTFAGHQAGYSATTASYNTFLGEEAGYTTSTGTQNTYVGLATGYYSTTGSYNTFSGFKAGASNTTGHDNTFAGWEAGYSNATGVGNVFNGDSAGINSHGSYDTFLGFLGGYNNTTGNNDIYIGTRGATSGTESNAIRIGGDIGTGYGAQTATYVAGIYQESVDAGTAVNVVVDVNGKLGTILSSGRFKEQVRDMGDSTTALMKLRPVTFLYKPEYSNGSRTLQFGLIAEEVARVYPELVSYGNDGKPYTVRYQYLASMLLNEVQKQYHRAETQEQVIKTQQQQIESLERQNEEFQQRLSHLESLIGTPVKTAQDQPAMTTRADGAD